LLVVHGRVIAGSRAWKARRVDEDAFMDTNGELGTVDGSVVVMTGPVHRHGPFTGELGRDVALIKVLPGMDGSVIQQLPATTAGLIVEALPGTGGIPPAMQRDLSALADRIPVVVAPRAPFGLLPPRPTGGTGEPLANSPLLSCGPLTAEQAWLLLMLVLGEIPKPAEARVRFEREIHARR
jgi:L-asparaginase/Glu-tRNA(Gln) amidotransferase subunit D